MERRLEVRLRFGAGKTRSSWVLTLVRLPRFFLTTSKDMTGRLYTLYPVEGYRPKTFAGHRDAVVASYFSADHKTVRLTSSAQFAQWAYSSLSADLHRLARWGRLHVGSQGGR